SCFCAGRALHLVNLAGNRLFLRTGNDNTAGAMPMTTTSTHLRRRALVAAMLACGLAAAPLSAQERANTILVLDGSGSMWGQIDGVNKITIAREVVADILKTFPKDENLGLVAYGHRQRGQCSDIETLVAPAQGTAEQITRI